MSELVLINIGKELMDCLLPRRFHGRIPHWLSAICQKRGGREKRAHEAIPGGLGARSGPPHPSHLPSCDQVC